MSLCIHEIPLDKPCTECLGTRALSLATAARALIEHEEQVAKSCYREWNGTEWIWNEEIWAREEPEQFARIQDLRQALQSEWIRA